MTPSLDFGIGRPQALLITAALGADKAEGAAALAEWWQGIANYDEVHGTDSGLFAQIHANLGNRIPDRRLLARMKGAARHVWLRNQYMVADCATLVGTLADVGVPTMLLKGAAMVVAVDQGIGLRWMSDCDILVPIEAAQTCVRVLAETGLTEAQDLTLRDLSLAHGLTLHDKGSGRDRIDLHWQPIRDIGASSLARGMFAAGHPAEIGGRACQVPAFEHMVFHAIVHGTEWSPQPRYDWLVDTIKILRRAGPGFDWDMLRRTALDYRFGFLLAAALGEARRHFPDLVPRDAVAGLARRPVYFERREAEVRRAAPSLRTVGDELLVAAQKARRASDGALRRSTLRNAPAIYRSLYGPPRRSQSAPADLAVDFLYGWSAPESKGRWTDGHLASLRLQHAGPRPPSALRIRAHTLPAVSVGPQAVEVFAGFRHLGTLNWQADGAGPTAHMLELPAKAWRNGAMVLRFEIGRPAAPAALGLGGDPRALGMFLEEISPVAAPFDMLTAPLRLSDGAALPFLWHGWSPPEPSGAWTFGTRAVVRWQTPVPIPAGYRLGVAVIARAPGREPLAGRCRLDGRMTAAFTYPAAVDLATTLVLPLPRAHRAGETLTLAIEIDNPVSPARSIGTGDPRPLGLMVSALHIAPG